MNNILSEILRCFCNVWTKLSKRCKLKVAALLKIKMSLKAAHTLYRCVTSTHFIASLKKVDFFHSFSWKKKLSGWHVSNVYSHISHQTQMKTFHQQVLKHNSPRFSCWELNLHDWSQPFRLDQEKMPIHMFIFK